MRSEGQLTIVEQTCMTMGIPAPGQPPEPRLSTFSDDILKIEVSDPLRQQMSIIDLPGLFETSKHEATTREDIFHVQNTIKSYIMDSRNVILALLPAPEDTATQKILNMAEEADPRGQRTLGVLTHPDLVDQEGEGHSMDLVRRIKEKPNLDYCMIRDRGQQEKSLSSTDCHEKEKQLFNTEPWSTLDKERVGISALQARLRELLFNITCRELPNVKDEIDKRLSDCEHKLMLLGPARETEEEQRTLLEDLATEFQEITFHALDADYSLSSLFEGIPSLRLATRIIDLDTSFLDDMWLKGHTMHFSTSTTRHGDEPVPEPPDETIVKPPDEAVVKPPDDADKATTIDSSNSVSENDEFGASEFPELLDVIQGPWRCPTSLPDNVFNWIESVYQTSRGFELGVFDFPLLKKTFQEQSRNWDGIALTYISNVIRVVHSFMSDLLSALCPDRRVRSKLWTLINNELLERYKKAMSHTKFILHVERKGAPSIRNKHFKDILQKDRVERLNRALKGQPVPIKFGNEDRNVAQMDAVFLPVQMSIIERTVEDIHAILKSYYEVARQRFVDEVCMQAADHFLVTGPESPLRLFTPSFVQHMSLDSLKLIAGEDVDSRRARNVLMREKNCLESGKRLLDD